MVSVKLDFPGGTAAAAKSLQSRPTLRDPTDGSPPGSPVPGILQPRTLECLAISGTSGKKKKKRPPANAEDPGDVGLIPGSGRSPGAGKWQPTPVFLPGESMDREVWPATVHGIV